MFWCVCVDGFKMDVLVGTKMKAAAKCNKHCELHDHVNHLKLNSYFFFGLFLKSCFLSVIVCGCGCVCACVC